MATTSSPSLAPGKCVSSQSTGTPVARLVVREHPSKSTLMTLLHTCIRPFRPRLVKHASSEPVEGSQQLTPSAKARRKCRIQERKVDDIWMYDLTRHDSSTSAQSKREGLPRAARQRLYYFAGGGWQMPPGDEHWAFVAELVSRVEGLELTLVSYPLAPKCPAHISMPQLRKVYHSLMTQSRQQGEKVIFAGDSSGGNIVLALVLWCLAESERAEDSQGVSAADNGGQLSSKELAPEVIMAISPSADLRHTIPEIAETAKNDPILTTAFINSTADAWTGGTGMWHRQDDLWTKDDPRISPTLADVSLFAKYDVKVCGITASWDVLGPEAVIFRNKLRDVGVEGEWLDSQKQMHCFPLAFVYGLRESKEAMDWIAKILRHD